MKCLMIKGWFNFNAEAKKRSPVNKRASLLESKNTVKYFLEVGEIGLSKLIKPRLDSSKEELHDLGLHCLQIHPHLLDALLHCENKLFFVWIE